MEEKKQVLNIDVNGKNEKLDSDKRNENREKPKNNWWEKYYVYVISSLIIIAVVIVVLVVKKFWPFGDLVLLNGDFLQQSWPYMVELREKLASGESLLYTWNAGMGTNFYSILSLFFNPITLLFLVVPEKYIVQASTLGFLLTLLANNATMLIFLRKRPCIKLKKYQYSDILFSLSYTLCMYVISNINNWHFLICAAYFPLILLGLEQIVRNGKWKLYVITFALAMISNYYYMGLFCFFIILYFFTLQFNNWREFFKHSVQVLLCSVLAMGISGVVLIPVAIQITGQQYTVSGYQGNAWFTTFFDIIKNFLLFNQPIGRGTTGQSYGEVNLYYGLLPLLLTTFYFLNSKISIWMRIKRLVILALYLIAFDLNGLNYVMHMFHYTSWFPNRFSLFFTIYCLVLGHEAWESARENSYQNITLIKGLLMGVGWVVITILCFAFADTIQYQYTYYYSIMVFLLYMVLLLLMPLLQKKMAYVLIGIGVLEVCLNFSVAMMFRMSGASMSEVSNDWQKNYDFLQTHVEDEGFYRVQDGRTGVSITNGGMLYQVKGVTLFSSSLGDLGNFLQNIGIWRGANVMFQYTYNPAVSSMFSCKYIFRDNNIPVQQNNSENMYTNGEDVLSAYELINSEDNLALYENPTVLSVGYMIDKDADKLFEDGLESRYVTGDSYGKTMNEWIEGCTGVGDVLVETEAQPIKITADNCEAIAHQDKILITTGGVEYDLSEVENHEDEYVMDIDGLQEYQKDQKSRILVTYKVPEEGEYYIQILGNVAAAGVVEKGEKFTVYYDVDSSYFEKNETLQIRLKIYRFDETQWEKAYNILKQQQLEVTSYDSTNINGRIHVLEDGILFTSIPYDSNWHLYIDGKEEEILPLWENSFVATRIEKGNHEIQLVYKQKGLNLGVGVSIGSIILLVLLWIRDKKKRGNEE